MVKILLQMAAITACGMLWRVFHPGSLSVDSIRKVLTDLVYYLLLPALVLLVLWRTPLGLESVHIAAVASFGIVVCLLLSGLFCRLCRSPRSMAGAAILAAAFPNATYLGLPVLEATLGPAARGIAIQYDLFACTPLLLTAGIFVAQTYGTKKSGGWSLLSMFKVPPVWAALIAVLLNLNHVTLPEDVALVLERLGSAVIPLMLLALGMSLRWTTLRLSMLILLVPILVIQLIVMPTSVWWLAGVLGLSGDVFTAVVLEAAMPSMVLGLVLCDRYGLDTSLYATGVTLSTLLSLLTLPLWHAWL